MFSAQRAGVPVTARTSLQVDSVFTSLRIICNSIIDFGNLRAYKTKFSDDNVPYRAWVRGQPSILEQTWVPGMQQYDGVERTVMSMGLFGEAFWFVVERDNLGYATALEVLHPSFMRVEAGSGGRVIYKYGLPNDEKILDPDDVVHIPKMAMPGAVRGLSGIEYGQVIFAIALAAYEYGSRWFAQGASPSYLLSTKGKLNQAELTRIAEKFLFEHSGLQNSHLPMVVDNGMEVQKIQSTPDEAQFMQPVDVDTPLLTTTGWRTMGTVEVGDTVFAEDGSQTAVTDVSPFFLNSDCHELEFADGSRIVTSDDHRWHVYDVYKRKWGTLPTKEITETLRGTRGFRYRVACDGVVDLPESQLPIDPYILGYWLGDGWHDRAKMTVGLDGREHLFNELRRAEYQVLTVTRKKRSLGEGYDVSFSTGRRGEIAKHLRALSIFKNKRIPESYMLGSWQQRRALLAGLVDTDASLSSPGRRPTSSSQVEFTSTIKELAEDVFTLARSLGARAKITSKQPVGISRKVQWKVRWTATFDPFRLQAKRDKVQCWHTGRSTNDLTQMSVIGARRTMPRTTRCIRVDHPLHVFLVGRGLVPTGNTLEFARSAIFDWFGIPLFLRNNALERNSPEPPGTISERSTAFLRFTLTGYTVPLQQAFSELVPSGLHAAFDTSEFTRADVKSLSSEITALRNSQVASVNDIRVHKLGWEPADDPDADKVMLPLASNVSPQQTSPPQATPTAEPEPDDENFDRRPMTLREAASALSDAASALTRVAVADSARHEEQSKLLVSAAATALTQAEARDRDVQRKLSELDASVETAA